MSKRRQVFELQRGLTGGKGESKKSPMLKKNEGSDIVSRAQKIVILNEI